MRTAEITRDTRETQIRLSLNLDGSGKADIATGVGFLDHMLELFAHHGDFDLSVRCQGDTQVDGHHSVEDIGIVLGQAFTRALGDKRGIVRYGQFLLPMDETLVLCAADLSGRDFLGWVVELPSQRVGDFDTELGKEFWLAFVRACPGSVHIRQLAGENTHHILEAVFKGMGRTLKMAVALDPRHTDEIPSTKGVL
ncbi:imidazoleglycerol-phosphate dehydratase HisB [Colidextribacter sp. OB.20]|uniref:imidazoleglycerol-phosphate dehydratase HisB n=1 Tax=Colidextribacter sp. OB.20 TaxID=2304568 RepID=UPI001371EB6C|nr:imidazoleglycerol-phosphate dehydratase HisB [Colidextribacter sp. OB.20]NBI10774.1 imidazoleglycerol-phosphate dehydratase HisB [Colidextribacter sp. OB.20]